MQDKNEHIAHLIRSLRKEGPSVFLESQKKDHPASTTSYVAGKPKAWIKSVGNEVVVWDGRVRQSHAINPWKALDEFMNKHQDWVFGYLGYDLKNYVEDLDSCNPSKTSAPDMFFMIPGFLAEISKDDELKILRGYLPEYDESSGLTTEVVITSRNRIQKDDYLDKIKRVQKSITEGDFYEVNLSHALEFEFKGDPFELYSKMKAFGPVPFASYVEVDGISICCSSPERFLSRKGNKVWSQPIKGTWSRKGGSSDQSAELLFQSEKNRAENLMIVDLVRNDLSRIAKKGSVAVKNLFEIQSFETVHQMVSTVECEVKKNTNSIEIIKVCFPMGSMTGAPKISAMKAIEKMENYKRGIYSGAIGYITPEQDFDFNVVIRTAIIEGEKLVYPVGGAITSDSIPEEEWEETLVKARALISAVH
ncbi:MAG: anthranilate synthase component I family protein [Balneolaceae bacterium]|nr:anthranilate synthase component I family protein [Balneolaceae bacterium]MBO6547533.1 anthranilate synthase component I family protein [Balneolaceae bacterium]MBO6648045.1 anthranilate synthase component I family protein [Balneolaceae bacterium]